mmetsp:Transcript_27843/g.89297  ORF Transcript_27843/g.89297 Transcript_27843/m.89297 type:complete len:82 (-) Transcript_27843:68-313(-)
MTSGRSRHRRNHHTTAAVASYSPRRASAAALFSRSLMPASSAVEAPPSDSATLADELVRVLRHEGPMRDVCGAVEHVFSQK